MNNFDDLPRGSFLNTFLTQQIPLDDTISSPLVAEYSPTTISRNSVFINDPITDAINKYYFETNDIINYLDKFDKNLKYNIDLFFQDYYLSHNIEDYLKSNHLDDYLQNNQSLAEEVDSISVPENIVKYLDKNLDIDFDQHLKNQQKIKEYVSKKVSEMEEIKNKLDNIIGVYNGWKTAIGNFSSFLDNNNLWDSSELKKSIEEYQKNFLKKMGLEVVILDYVKVHAELSGIKMFVVKYTNEIEEYGCPICKSSNVRSVLIPCGHTYCEICVNQLQNNICPICRSQFASTQKLFFN